MFKQRNLTEKFSFFLCFFLIINYSSNVAAQNKPLDNWDLEVLSKKDLQIETYLDFTKRGELHRTGSNTYLRYGMSKNYELQVSYSSMRLDVNPENTYVNQSAGVGIKAFLVDDSKYLPGISLIGRINLTPSPSVWPIYPSLNILFRKGLFKNVTLTGNYEFILDEQEGELYNDFALNLDVEVTNWLMMYVGVTGKKNFRPTLENAEYQEYVEIGALLWITKNWRLYSFYNVGLGGDANDIINVGVLHNF